MALPEAKGQISSIPTDSRPHSSEFMTTSKDLLISEFVSLTTIGAVENSFDRGEEGIGRWRSGFPFLSKLSSALRAGTPKIDNTISSRTERDPMRFQST